MKFLQHRNHSFLQPCTRFLYINMNPNNDFIDVEDNQADFHEAKEQKEKALRTKILNTFNQYEKYQHVAGDTAGNTAKDEEKEDRINDIMARVRLTIKGRENKDQVTADMTWDSLDLILRKYNSASVTAGTSQEALSNPESTFSGFNSAAARSELTLNNTAFGRIAPTDPRKTEKEQQREDLKQWIADNGYSFQKAAAGTNEVYTVYQGRVISRTPHGIVGIYPTFGKDQKINGFMNLDADGDITVCYPGGIREHTETENPEDFNAGKISQEVTDQARGMRGKMTKALRRLGIGADVSRANFDRRGTKRVQKGKNILLDDENRTIQPTDAEIQSIADKTRNPAATKDIIENASDKQSHIDALERIGQGSAIRTVDSSGNSAYISKTEKKLNILQRTGRWFSNKWKNILG